MKDNIQEVIAAAVIRRCTMDSFRGFQTKTQGYCRSFLARYYDTYIDENGERIHINKQITVRGFNDIARFMKDEFVIGQDEDGTDIPYHGNVYVAGALETYEDNYGLHQCIKVINIKDMIKLPEVF